MKKSDAVLKEVLERIKPPKEDLQYINKNLKDFTEKLKNSLNKNKINAEVFVGGSYAKKTLIKKDSYDIDVFLRFDKSYENKEIPNITKKILSDISKFTVIHGSRDYFKITLKENFFIEVVPVKKFKNPKDSENITDLSYLHVKYANKKIKTEKILNEIKIAKAFCHANECYGAESYINGFSGYSLELLVYYYKGFLNFIKAMSKIGKEKLIIDIEKKHKNKKNILLDINSSKLQSPVILIDPTYSQRNALAALSNETFAKFQRACKEFLKSGSIKSFEKKKIDIEELKKESIKKGNEILIIRTFTDKQEGDVAGSKLFKFYNHLLEEINKFFEIKKSNFEYEGKNSSKMIIVVKKKKEVIYSGPFKDDLNNVKKFKSEHKNVFEKAKRIYAKEEVKLSIKEFIEKWKNKNANRINQMYISEIKIIE